jgi:hypothetical protein
MATIRLDSESKMEEKWAKIVDDIAVYAFFFTIDLDKNLNKSDPFILGFAYTLIKTLHTKRPVLD